MPLRHAVEACPPQELDLESGTGIPYLKMEDDAFEWDDAKAAENWRCHGVSFQQGAKHCATHSRSNGSTIVRTTLRSVSTCLEWGERNSARHIHGAWRAKSDHLGSESNEA
jgi:hypothetical protein